MKNFHASLDLGSTNIKAALYAGESLSIAAGCSRPMEYFREGNRVEFDADSVIKTMFEMLCELGGKVPGGSIKTITLTGQAESLILLDKNFKPLRRAISWMDERSLTECGVLAQKFSAEEIYNVTGQKAIIPTWPATKIIHLFETEPECIAKTAFFVLLKDYVAWKLSGVFAADKSIATFSLYFDIFRGSYWEKMLDACGIRAAQLPLLIEPCTVMGSINPALNLGAAWSQARVNTGTLDHFAGMIGSGNIAPGALSESTGTVMAMAAMLPLSGGDCAKPSSFSAKENAALHYGPFPRTLVLLPVAESGGICLELFRNNFLPGRSFEEINKGILEHADEKNNRLIFLPYLAGVNAPEYDRDACGIFYGLRSETNVYDMAKAVMEGVAMLLDRNLAAMRGTGLDFSRIICTGGAAKSDLWCRIKADVCGCEVLVPEDSETACRGAAIIGAVSCGDFCNYEEAVKNCVKIKKQFLPQDIAAYRDKKAGFEILYKAMLETAAAMTFGK